MSRFPLFVATRDLIFGNGFWAEVSTVGKALYVIEDDGHWIYGVNPGGLAGTGENLAAANVDYVQHFKGVLIELANEAEGFEAFRDAAVRFFNETNAYQQEEWAKAVAAAQASELLGLKRVPASTAIAIDIERKAATFSVADNVRQQQMLSLAAKKAA